MSGAGVSIGLTLPNRGVTLRLTSWNQQEQFHRVVDDLIPRLTL